MCLPVIAAVAAVVSIAGDVAKSAAQDKAHAANKAAALKAEMQAFTDLSSRQVEEQVAATNQKDAADRQARSVIGSAVTAATESGVGGNSVTALLHNMDADRARYDERVDVNTATNLRQLDREKAGAEATALSRIAAVPASNPFATGLAIGGDILGGIAGYENATKVG